MGAFTPQGSRVTETATARNGRYTLTGLAAGNYLVSFASPGCGNSGSYVTQWYNNQPTQATANPVAVTAGGDTRSINAALQPGGSISGTVTAAGGGPLGGICVAAITPQGAVEALTATAPDGTYTLTGLAAGNYLANFQSSEYCNAGNSGSYVAQWYNNQPTQATANTVAVTAGADTRSINAAMQPGGSISGTVTAAGGGPLDGICVGTVTPQGVNVIFGTAPDGTYTLTGLPAGNYLVEFLTTPSPCASNSGSYVIQWYNDQPTQATANPVAVTVGVDTGSINAALEPG